MRRLPAAKVLFMVASMVVLLLALFLAVRSISHTTFSSLESREATANVERVREAVFARRRTLASIAGDWAPWDDSYQLLLGKQPDFAEVNLQPETLMNLKVDLMAFVSNEGRIVEKVRVDQETSEVLPLPRSLSDLIESQPSYLQLTDVDQSADGVVVLPEGPLLFAASPVTDSLGEKAPPGYLLVGRFLDKEEVEALSQQTGLAVSIQEAAASGTLPAAIQSGLAKDGLARPVIVPVNAHTTVGFGSVADPLGKPALVISVRMPRAIYLAGQRTMSYFGIVLALFGAIALALVASFMIRQEHEIDERRRAEDAMRESEEKYRRLVSHMADAVIGLSLDGRIIFANLAASALTGHTNTRLLAMAYTDLVAPGSAPRVRAQLTGEDASEASESLDILHASGRVVPVEVSVSRMHFGDGVDGVQWIARDVTERRRYEAELVHLASHDYLTGLPNRRRFEEELAEALARSARTGRSGALLWMDIDDFKDVNDTFGHKAGDDILVNVATLLQQHVRSDSVLGRLGGDEFGVLMHDASLEEAVSAAERLLREIRDSQFAFEGRRVRVTSSVGLVLYPDHGTTPEELLARADLSMYHAKQEDLDRCCVYRPDESWPEELDSRFEWAGAIERALAEDRFLVYAQPIVGVEDGQLDRHELLIRLQAEDGSIVTADAFIRVAERVGLIREIDRWMVRQAVQLIASHLDTHGPLRLDVNVSGKAVSDPEMLALIQTELEEAEVEPSLLGIEITETAAISDMVKARTFIERLKDIGCRVLLDDFGSGFSSFYYLNSLPVDGLKIDGGFVRNLQGSRRDQHIVQAIVELCRGFGIASTAEWVEDAKTFVSLRDYGVTHAQGWALGRPVPVEEALAACEPPEVSSGGDTA